MAPEQLVKQFLDHRDVILGFILALTRDHAVAEEIFQDVAMVILEEARRAIQSDRMNRPAKCSVCGEECAPNSAEGLCWVCRRLKLSAWRDSDTQMPAQE